MMPSENRLAPNGSIMKDGVTVIGTFTVSGYTADEAGWKQYLKDYVSAVPATQDYLDEFFEAIDAGAFDTKPGDMLYADVFWGYHRQAPIVLIRFHMTFPLFT